MVRICKASKIHNFPTFGCLKTALFKTLPNLSLPWLGSFFLSKTQLRKYLRVRLLIAV